MSGKITKIGITNDKISSRGGIALFLRYISNIGLYDIISIPILLIVSFGKKGLRLEQFLKQIFAFMIDGTHTNISHFENLKKDKGYASLLENTDDQMASSHQIKRFIVKLSIINSKIFSRILHSLFIWRLNIEQPKVIILGIDTMVLDNDDAAKREGCEPTYKKKKGFQPLHICWGPFLIDVLFRKGSAHSNHGTDYTDRVKVIVDVIRKRYSKNVPIIICADSGFADQKAYTLFEEQMGIHYITTSRIYQDVKDYIQELPLEEFGTFSKNKSCWAFTEFGNKLKSWKKFRRCIFTKLKCEENGQYTLSFDKPDNVIYTNIGQCKEIDDKLRAATGESYFTADAIIELSHQRGADELIHRSIKELATKEQLPFKSMGMNRVYYFLLVITHFIFETYKRDITEDIIPATSYPNTFRRKLIDFAVKITSGAGYIILNVPKTIWETVNFEELWKRVQSPPRIVAG